MREERRRLAVLDDSGRLIGLLCLKGNGTGYCADDGRRGRRELVCRRGERIARVSAQPQSDAKAQG